MTESTEQTGTKIWWRHWSVVLVFAVMAGLVIWGMVNLGPWLKTWQERRDEAGARKRLEQTYREDQYGGRTPQETLNLFIAALKIGDTNLASKYFVVEKQEQWQKALDQYKKAGLLSQFVRELQTANSADFNSANFKQYPSGNWKISEL